MNLSRSFDRLFAARAVQVGPAATFEVGYTSGVGLLSAIGSGLWTAFLMLWDTLWALVLGFGLSGAVQAFVSRAEMQRVLGDRKPRTLAVASVLGAVSSSCSYAASAMAKSLFSKGADFTAAMVFMLASTNLVVELGLVLWILIGWQFALSEYVGGIIMIALLAVAARFFFTPPLVAAARARVSSNEDGHGDHRHGVSEAGEAGNRQALWRRLRSAGGWANAASYTMADLAMLRRELVIGYLVAGFLAALVPVSVWNAVFFHGHGFATSLENAIVGPFVAIVSFVCSIGNVPLAAALWSGGISFGGVVSFIFADLITLPLLLIYRRMYGWPMTLRILAAFWLVMSAAGLVTQYLFALFGLLPRAQPLHLSAEGLTWNYTTILNLIALAVFGLLLWLARNRERLGGGTAYAIDPVCGMQVEKRSAPARLNLQGRTLYFCSDHCRDRYLKTPHRDKSQASA
jgi:uncharacterized membrane protein YraQ (UPF0718 family)/YHS domain-containing protein